MNRKEPQPLPLTIRINEGKNHDSSNMKKDDTKEHTKKIAMPSRPVPPPAPPPAPFVKQ